MKKIVVFYLLILSFNFTALYSDTAYEEGLKLFRADKPDEARRKFEDALVRDNRNENIYNYLGIIYFELNNPAKALEIMQNGLLVATTLKPTLYFNIGNIFSKTGDNTLAEKNYTLAIGENSLFADAYLNRANTRMNLVRYKDAIDDYKTYLRLKSDTPQRKDIEKLIALLEQGIHDQENLLQSVLNSIKNASTDSQTSSAGTEGFKETGTKEPDILN